MLNIKLMEMSQRYICSKTQKCAKFPTYALLKAFNMSPIQCFKFCSEFGISGFRVKLSGHDRWI